jgi:hypothetical protein
MTGWAAEEDARNASCGKNIEFILKKPFHLQEMLKSLGPVGPWEHPPLGHMPA